MSATAAREQSNTAALESENCIDTTCLPGLEWVDGRIMSHSIGVVRNPPLSFVCQTLDLPYALNSNQSLTCLFVSRLIAELLVARLTCQSDQNKFRSSQARLPGWINVLQDNLAGEWM